MRLRTLTLEHFRSYPALSLTFGHAPVQVFVGPNGAGKTNIVESIALLSLMRSVLGAEEEDLRTWEAGHYRVRADAVGDDGTLATLEVVSQITPRRAKACFLRDVRTGVADFVGVLPVALFLPQETGVFGGPPQGRRGFLDRILCQASPVYLRALVTYQRALKQRNALLRKIAEGTGSVEDLQVWDLSVAQQGAVIIRHRLELLEVFQRALQEELLALGESWRDPVLVYERHGGAHAEDTASELLALMTAARERDLLLQTTTVGPHRDDWHMAVGGRPLPSFASRGQQRVALLALLFLEASFVETRRGERPVILLDDIFSELDDAHQEAVLRAFGDHQVFITATHLPSCLHGADVWEVSRGAVTAMEQGALRMRQ